MIGFFQRKFILPLLLTTLFFSLDSVYARDILVKGTKLKQFLSRSRNSTKQKEEQIKSCGALVKECDQVKVWSNQLSKRNKKGQCECKCKRRSCEVDINPVLSERARTALLKKQSFFALGGAPNCWGTVFYLYGLTSSPSHVHSTELEIALNSNKCEIRDGPAQAGDWIVIEETLWPDQVSPTITPERLQVHAFIKISDTMSFTKNGKGGKYQVQSVTGVLDKYNVPKTCRNIRLKDLSQQIPEDCHNPIYKLGNGRHRYAVAYDCSNLIDLDSTSIDELDYHEIKAFVDRVDNRISCKFSEGITIGTLAWMSIKDSIPILMEYRKELAKKSQALDRETNFAIFLLQERIITLIRLYEKMAW
jgi:hypothetical protein